MQGDQGMFCRRDAEGEELALIEEALGNIPLAGFFGNGETSHNRLYASTGVLALLV